MKNGILQNFLNNLSDREFAFFYSYRRSEFMKESQENIDKEIPKRNLTNTQIERLIDYTVTYDESCMRCQSENFQPIVDTRLVTKSYTAYEIEFHSRKCRVCGYNPFKDKTLNFKIRWNKFLGRYHWKKLK